MEMTAALRKKIQALQHQLQRLECMVNDWDSADYAAMTKAVEDCIARLNRFDSMAPGNQERPERREAVGADPEYFGKALELIPDGHFVTDLHGCIQLANPAGARMVNMPPSQLVNTTLLQFITPQFQSVLKEYLETLEHTELDIERDILLQPCGKPPLPATVAMSVLRGPEGDPLAVHWLIRDLTEKTRGLAAEGLLQNIGEQVLEGLTLHQVLSLVCEHLVGMFGYPFVWIGMLEPQGAVTVHAYAGDHVQSFETIRAQEAQINSPENPVTRAIAQRRIQLMRVDDPAWASWAAWAQNLGIQAGVCMPLTSKGQVLGALSVYSRYPEAFDAGVVRWFEKLSSQVSLSLLVAKDQENLRLRGAAIASAEHAVFITDHDGHIEWINDAYARLTGYSASEVIGTLPACLQSETLQAAIHQMSHSGVPGQFWQEERREQRKDGSAYVVEQILTPLRDNAGRVTHFVVVHQDITVRKEAEARNFYLAYHDPLTDLPNRPMFDDRLAQALAQARRHSRFLAVLFVDLDRLKPVNDCYGHDVGDRMLKIVGQGMQRCIRETDTVARLSGDEFTLVLQDLERAQDAGHVAQKVLDVAAQPLQVEGETVSVTASIGIAIYPVDATEAEDLMIEADRAMYRAKGKGGNCYQFASEEMNAEVFECLTLERSLPLSWERHEFCMHFQPEVNLRDGRIVGVEALIRWQHPELGLLFPSRFLPVAQELGHLRSIQEWAVAAACRQCAQWQRDGLPVPAISVNMPMEAFGSEARDSLVAAEYLREITAQTELDPHSLRIEIPESWLHRPDHSGLSSLQHLCDTGVRVVLDDVVSVQGFERAESFIHEVKVAHSLIAHLPDDHQSVLALQAIVEWSRRCNVSVVAKGVESAQQITALQELGCYIVQGYLLHRPLPEEEMTLLLHGWWASEF